jgi:hypothetical protein
MNKLMNIETCRRSSKKRRHNLRYDDRKKQQSHRNQAWEIRLKNKSKENRKRLKRVGRATTDFYPGTFFLKLSCKILANLCHVSSITIQEGGGGGSGHIVSQNSGACKHPHLPLLMQQYFLEVYVIMIPILIFSIFDWFQWSILEYVLDK